MFTPSADDLETLLSWIGGGMNCEVLPLTSIRSRIARKLIENFSWEAVNNSVSATISRLILLNFRREIT